MQVSRRELFKYAAAGTAAAGLAALAGPSVANAGPATLIDYSAGVPSPLGIRAAGHVGAIRYVSDRRPGAEWMLGKPMQFGEAAAMAAFGLQIVSCYQFGKGQTSDWRGGFDAGIRHAQRGLELHRAAGGPENCPIYASIDDNPSPWEFDNLIAPYLRAGRRSSGGATSACTPTRRPSTVACAPGSGDCSGSTIGDPRPATCIRPRTCTSSRSTSDRSRASASTSLDPQAAVRSMVGAEAVLPVIVEESIPGESIQRWIVAAEL